MLGIAVVTVFGCGDGSSLVSSARSGLAVEMPTWSERRDAPRAITVPHPSAPLLQCAGLSFRPSALRRPRGYERRDTPLARSLARFLRRSAREVAQPRRGWFLLARREGVAEVAAGDLPELGHMAFERRDGRWEWAGSGGCRPVASHRGRMAVTWQRERHGALPPETTRIPILVHEDECSSGLPAHGRILRPLVHYGRGTVTVTYFIRRAEGFQTCQGGPPTPAMLVLDQPLGGRTLRDGGPHPPRPRN